MEKILSPEERIRRAEEVYYRRRMNNVNAKTTKVNISSKKDFGMLKKMVLQIAICLVIYFVFYIIQHSNYIFSENVINRTKEILSYDINIEKVYKNCTGYLNSFFSQLKVSITPLQKEEESESIITNDESERKDNTKINEDNTDSVSTEKKESKDKNLSQMEKDAKGILANKSLIIPLKGTITSRFGIRDPETPTVPKNHTGIDIAASEGTVFIASMSGTVEEVSSEGDLGNHIKIVNGDVATVYAHCKKIYVKEGQKIKQGKSIGEVGSTGNSTGPHLHFEIRKENRYVDPDLVLDF